MAKKTTKKTGKTTPKLEAMLGEFMEKVDERLSALEAPPEEEAPQKPSSGNGEGKTEYVPFVQGIVEPEIIQFIDALTGRDSGEPAKVGDTVNIPEFWGGGTAQLDEEARGIQTPWKVRTLRLSDMLQAVVSDQGRVSIELKLKQEARFMWVRVLSFNPSGSFQHYTAYYGSERARNRSNGS